MDTWLIYLVTLFGFFLSALSFMVVFRGKRIPGDTGATQELEFKGLKMKTNSVVMLLAVSAIVTVLPLSLLAWLESLRTQIPAATTPNSATPEPVQPLKIYITGQVLDANGPIEGAKVTVVNLKHVKPGDPLTPLEERITDSSGSFDFSQLTLGTGDRLKVAVDQKDYVEQQFYLGPSGAVDVRTVLVAKRRNGGAQ